MADQLSDHLYLVAWASQSGSGFIGIVPSTGVGVQIFSDSGIQESFSCVRRGYIKQVISMKIFYFAIAAILISLGLVPGLVLAIPGDTAGSFSMTPSDMILTPLPDLPEEIFFTPFIFPFDLITPHDRAVLMDHATPDLWYIPIPNPEYWIVPALEEDEEIEKSDEYIFQGSITVGPWMPGLDSDIFAAFNSEPINVGPVIEGQVYTMSETAGPCGPPEQMRDPGLLEAFRS